MTSIPQRQILQRNRVIAVLVSSKGVIPNTLDTIARQYNTVNVRGQSYLSRTQELVSNNSSDEHRGGIEMRMSVDA